MISRELDEDVLEWIINEAIKLGASEVECYASYAKAYNVDIMAGEARQPSYYDEAGLGIRVILGKKIGFAATNVFDKESIRDTIKKAISIAKASKENPNWVKLPEKSKYESVKGILDKAIIELGGEDILDKARALLSTIYESDKRVMPVWGGVSAGYLVEAIANSNNIMAKKEGTYLGASIGTIARDKEVTTPIHTELLVSRKMDINFEELGRRIVDKTIKSLTIRKIESGSYPAIMDPEALFMIFVSTFYQIIGADYAQMGRSPYINKIGEEVASQALTIIDDGTLEGGVMSAPFDDEGSPTRRKLVIDRGIFKGFLYDNYRARIEGVESTGNAFRGFMSSLSQPRYLSLPSIFPSNIIIQNGTISLDEMIRDINRGVFIIGVQGAHASNPETGEVSVVATPAWVIENGEIKGLSPGLMINMNIYEALKDIVSLSKEIKQEYNLLSPWIEFRNIRFISKS